MTPTVFTANIRCFELACSLFTIAIVSHLRTRLCICLRSDSYSQSGCVMTTAVLSKPSNQITNSAFSAGMIYSQDGVSKQDATICSCYE